MEDVASHIGGDGCGVSMESRSREFINGPPLDRVYTPVCLCGQFRRMETVQKRSKETVNRPITMKEERSIFVTDEEHGTRG